MRSVIWRKCTQRLYKAGRSAGPLGLMVLGLVMSSQSPTYAASSKIKGNYAVQFHGDGGFYIGTGLIAVAKDNTVTGTLYFNGDGSICTDTVSGIATLNSDGITGTLSLTLAFVSSSNSSSASACGDTDALTLAFARDNGGKTLELVEMDPYSGSTFAETFEQVVGVANKAAKLKKKGTYGFQFTGDYEFYTASGTLTVGTGGTVTGTMSFNADGDLCIDNLSGIATPNSDGETGTLALTLAFVSSSNGNASACGDGVTMMLGIAGDNGGKEVLLADLDPYNTGTFAESFDPVYGVAHAK